MRVGNLDSTGVLVGLRAHCAIMPSGVHPKYCLGLPVDEEGGGAGFLTGIDFGFVCCYFVGCLLPLARTGPIRYIGREAIQTEIANSKAALEGVEVDEAFMARF